MYPENINKTNSQFNLKNLLTNRFNSVLLPPFIIFFLILAAVSALSIFWISDDSQENIVKQSEEQLSFMTIQIADNISERLKAIRRQSELLQTEATLFINNPESCGFPEKLPKTTVSPKGVLYKSEKNGGASALFFTTRKISEKEKEVLYRSEKLDLFFAKIHKSNPNIALTYFMNDKNFLRMYPWQDDLHKHVSSKMKPEDIMVYYSADKSSNPSQQPCWTSVYLDHIGYGWMVTCTAPLYDSNNKMKGVVGIDLTVKHFEKYLSKCPEHIKPVLLDSKKNIIYTTPDMEKMFGIHALKDRLEPGNITEEFIFPDEFNLLKTSNKHISQTMKKVFDGPDSIHKFKSKEKDFLIYSSTLAEAGWTLVMLADKDILLKAEETIRKEAIHITLVCITIFVSFTILYIFYLKHKAETLSKELAEPIRKLENAVDAAARQDRLPELAESGISEIDCLAENIKAMDIELREHRSNLEERIDERTEQLNKSNVELQIALEKAKDVQHALIRAERLAAVGTLAGGIAHEFNNINTSIIGFTEIALSDLPKDFPTRENLERVRRIAGRASTITRNLLAFSGSSGEKSFICNLVDIFKDSLMLVRDKFTSDGITFDIDLEEVPETLMDPAQIGQVLLNFLINAEHAMVDRQERKITVRAGSSDNEIWISVEDTGCGIAEDRIPRIFSPFVSTKGEHAETGSSQHQVKGTGLGLSVSQTIVENHGGSIKVRSTPDEGSCFTLILPIRDIESYMPDKRQEGHTTSVDLSGKSILVLDDDDDICELLKIRLRKDKVNIVDCADGESALELCGVKDFDLILLDLQMPGISGHQFLKEIKKLKENPPPCLVITGLQDEKAGKVTEDENVCGFLAKPFTIDEIVLKIKEVLSAD
ncbi:MAG: ATP-binding protein [Planctomycetota bacterium]|jgi:C4-dicarboxylate-specific signal transduction histidine kinase/CheY-like chemotaxis protein